MAVEAHSFMTEDDPTGAYSKKGQAIAIGEDICKNYARMGNDVVILRLDHLYGEIRKKEDTDTICADMCLEAVQTGEIIASQNEKIMLLHEADAVEFIYQIMVAKDHKHTLYQLSSGEKMSRYELAQAVAAGMENEVSIVEEENKNTGKLCFPVKDTMKNLEAVCFIMQEQMWKRLRLISADMYLNLQMQGRKRDICFED